MIAEPPIPELGRVAATALTEVLATQFKLSEIASAPADKPVTRTPDHCLVGLVSLSGGRISGDILLQLPEGFVAKLTGLLLGQSATGVSDESAADVTGEVCNMLAGRVAAILSAAGYSSQLSSTPTVVRGHRLELEISPGAKTCRSTWTCEGHLLTVALQFRFKSR
jgi:CheY-specific phosphatase CheX